MVLGLVSSIMLASGSILHALRVIMFGLLLGLVGADVNSGVQRYTLGQLGLSDGINFVIVAMGIFGVGAIIANLEVQGRHVRSLVKVESLMPTRSDLRTMVPPMLRGILIGSAFGILPGSGTSLASFSAYALEKKVAKNAHQLGKGAIEGVAAPEAANNAAAQMSFIPMLTLGLPANSVMALMIDALLIHGIQRGPSSSP